jgi:GNAT superfamily N-acetyltransferase
MSVRRARTSDTAAIVAMGRRFVAEGPYQGQVALNVEQIERLTAFLLEHGAIFLALNELQIVGMLGAQVVVHPVGGELTGSEAAWWMNPEARGGLAARRMVKAAEAWAFGLGAVWFQMVAPFGDKVGRFYEAAGYRPLETVYQKRLAA